MNCELCIGGYLSCAASSREMVDAAWKDIADSKSRLTDRGTIGLNESQEPVSSPAIYRVAINGGHMSMILANKDLSEYSEKQLRAYEAAQRARNRRIDDDARRLVSDPNRLVAMLMDDYEYLRGPVSVQLAELCSEYHNASKSRPTSVLDYLRNMLGRFVRTDSTKRTNEIAETLTDIARWVVSDKYPQVEIEYFEACDGD